jgi:hypothetical protein
LYTGKIMIEFKKNVNKAIPYDRQHYLEFLSDHLAANLASSTKCYGVSFQLPGGFEGRAISLTEYLDAYENWFKNIIKQFDNGSDWIVNHDITCAKWFPNNEDNLSTLRTLLRENYIPKEFNGALIFTTDDLLKFSEELISYPIAVFNRPATVYHNLDISNSKIPFIFKISNHANIDLLSTDKNLLKAVVEANTSDGFILRPYRGTSL